MKKTNSQKLIEDKRPKKNVLIILLIFSLFLFIFLIGLLFYFWIDFQDKNEVNRKLIDQLKYDIENSINEKFKKESFSKLDEYDNLSKELNVLSKKILSFEKRINENENSSNEIYTYLNNLNLQLNGIKTQLKENLENDNKSLVENNFTNTLPNYVMDLPSLLEKLNYELNENINWSETLKEIYNTENKSFLNRFSIELNILQQYSIVPPPTLKSLKSNFKQLIPLILESLPNEKVSFLNDKINWIVKSIRLRRTDLTEGKNPYELMSNIEYYLNKNNLQGVVENFQKLPKKMQNPALEWFNDIKSRFKINNSKDKIFQNYKDYTK